MESGWRVVLEFDGCGEEFYLCSWYGIDTLQPYQSTYVSIDILQIYEP